MFNDKHMAIKLFINNWLFLLIDCNHKCWTQYNYIKIKPSVNTHSNYKISKKTKYSEPKYLACNQTLTTIFFIE